MRACGYLRWLLGRVPKVTDLAVVLFTFTAGNAQITKTDSDPLRDLVATDSTAVIELLDRANSLMGEDPDSAITLSIQAIELSEEINYDLGKANGFKSIGMAHFRENEYDEAIEFFQRSLAVFRGIGDTTGISNMQSNLGAVHMTTGNNIKALEYLVPSAKNAQIVRDTFRMGSAYLNLGSIYSNEAETYDQAEVNYLLAIEMFRALDARGSENPNILRGIYIATANLGEVYLNRNQPNEAIPYLRESIEAARLIDGTDVAAAINWLAEAYLALGQFDLAQQYYSEALQEAQDFGSKFSESKSYIGLGKNWLAQEQYTAAIADFQNGLELARELGLLREQRDAALGIADAHAAMNNYSEAFAYQRLYGQIQDTLRSANTADAIQKMRIQFESDQQEQEIELLTVQNELSQVQIKEKTRAQNLLLIILGLFLAIIAGFIFQYFYIRKTNRRLAFERNRSDQILLNILPKEAAEELKDHGYVKTQEFDQITVLFTDFKAFSVIAERISAEMLVKSVDYYFKNFDAIMERFNVEKIKTIGDAYMCAAGIPTPNSTHAQDAFSAALEILKFTLETEMDPPKGIYPFKIRIGLNTGPVVAGVVGTKKFAYDIWGNTVNIASRMESSSVHGRINVSENTYQELKDYHQFSYRGEIEVKNGQMLRMYFAELEADKLEVLKI